MAIIHEATLAPTKLELLTSWLPGRSWYPGDGAVPLLTKAGGFRLDDPDGKVGLEFMAVTDASGDEPVTYHVPLSYRGAPLTGADERAHRNGRAWCPGEAVDLRRNARSRSRGPDVRPAPG